MMRVPVFTVFVLALAAAACESDSLAQRERAERNFLVELERQRLDIADNTPVLSILEDLDRLTSVSLVIDEELRETASQNDIRVTKIQGLYAHHVLEIVRLSTIPQLNFSYRAVSPDTIRFEHAF